MTLTKTLAQHRCNHVPAQEPSAASDDDAVVAPERLAVGPGCAVGTAVAVRRVLGDHFAVPSGCAVAQGC